MASDDPPAGPEAALRLVGTDPLRARRLAADAVATARERGDSQAESRAHRALGRAAYELGAIGEAVAAMRTAIRVAERGDDQTTSAEARMSLAYVLSEQGQTREALAQLDRAEPALRGPAGAELLAQRGLVLWRCGRTTEALDSYRRALPRFRRAGDRLAEARLCNNRGLLYVDRGELAAAEADLVRAADLLQQLGQGALAADAEYNLGYVAFRRSDIPAALRLLDSAEASYRKQGIPPREMLLTRGELLLSVGAFLEAQNTAIRAIELFSASGWRSLLAEALLLHAQAALSAADTATSRESAVRAARLFSRQRRPGWAAVARYVALRADERAGHLTPAVRREALRTADNLAALGWRTQELDARIIAARVALEQGNVTTVEREMHRLAGARTSGPTELRIRAWYAEALLRLATGRRPAAEQALRAGMRVIERQRATLGATELRVHVAGHGQELARLGIDLAMEAGSAAKVLDWTERSRARTMGLRPVRPPDDEDLAAALSELRRVTAEAEAALLGGPPAKRLLGRRSAIEQRVQRLARRATGALFTGLVDPPPVDRIAAVLGDRLLVELISHGDALYAVTICDGRAELHDLGALAPVRRAQDALLFALRRLAQGHGSPDSLASARVQVTTTASRLQEFVLDPLAHRLGDRPLVVVPTGSLRSMPWSLLPACAGRAVTVAPSAALWLRAAGLPPEHPKAGRVVLVCGPRLDGAAAEIDQLAAAYPDAVRLDGPSATVGATLAALDGADVAHVAAHGRLRGDNPLFSALELADGPLTVYDLEQLTSAPRLVLLPACQSGEGSVLAGDEVMGLTSALFALGTRSAVATVIPVEDQATRPLMVALHDGLRQGLSAAQALAAAQAEAAGSDHATLATAGGFVCYGAG